MTNTKAQVGDLVRIINANTSKGKYRNGGIYEVSGTWGNGVLIDVEPPYNDIYHTEYVIHRKAGEEDSDVVGACASCGAEIVDGVSTPSGRKFCDIGCYAEQDAVNQPPHYTQGKFETIEVIEEFTKGYDDGYVAYCVGNALKYEARAPFKHDTPLEDLRKAARYLAYAIDYLDAKST